VHRGIGIVDGIDNAAPSAGTRVSHFQFRHENTERVLLTLTIHPRPTRCPLLSA
jgi:hypothetical protein